MFLITWNPEHPTFHSIHQAPIHWYYKYYANHFTPLFLQNYNTHKYEPTVQILMTLILQVLFRPYTTILLLYPFLTLVLTRRIGIVFSFLLYLEYDSQVWWGVIMGNRLLDCFRWTWILIIQYSKYPIPTPFTKSLFPFININTIPPTYHLKQTIHEQSYNKEKCSVEKLSHVYTIKCSSLYPFIHSPLLHNFLIGRKLYVKKNRYIVLLLIISQGW